MYVEVRVYAKDREDALRQASSSTLLWADWNLIREEEIIAINLGDGPDE